MSTKFNNNQKLQPTPKICKYVPPPPPDDDTKFPKYPLQAYATWNDYQTPLEQAISGTTLLDAYPDEYRHAGSIAATRATLELVLQYDPLTLQFRYEITLYIEGLPTKTVGITFTDPPAKLPFRAGLYVWHVPGTDEYIESIILS